MCVGVHEYVCVCTETVETGRPHLLQEMYREEPDTSGGDAIFINIRWSVLDEIIYLWRSGLLKAGKGCVCIVSTNSMNIRKRKITTVGWWTFYCSVEWR